LWRRFASGTEHGARCACCRIARATNDRATDSNDNIRDDGGAAASLMHYCQPIAALNAGAHRGEAERADS
jgi:hypothetical protein